MMQPKLTLALQLRLRPQRPRSRQPWGARSSCASCLPTPTPVWPSTERRRKTSAAAAAATSQLSRPPPPQPRRLLARRRLARRRLARRSWRRLARRRRRRRPSPSAHRLWARSARGPVPAPAREKFMPASKLAAQSATRASGQGTPPATRPPATRPTAAKRARQHHAASTAPRHGAPHRAGRVRAAPAIQGALPCAPRDGNGLDGRPQRAAGACSSRAPADLAVLRRRLCCAVLCCAACLPPDMAASGASAASFTATACTIGLALPARGAATPSALPTQLYTVTSLPTLASVGRLRLRACHTETGLRRRSHHGHH